MGVGASAEFSIKRYVHRLDHEEMIWTVQEFDGADIPGARGKTCLVFESPEVVRRLWVYPAGWATLDDESLRRLVERSPEAEAHLESLGTALARAIATTANRLEHTARLLAAIKHASDENCVARNQLKEMLVRCRAERAQMRSAVELYARELQRGGIGANDAAFLVRESVRERAHPPRDLTSASDVERNADRWCAMVYAPAA